MALLDRTGKRLRWEIARRAESHYNSRLRQVALQVGGILRVFAPGGAVKSLQGLLRMLEGYADAMRPWAEAAAEYMVADVARRTDRLWRENSKAMGLAIRAELAQGRSGAVFEEARREQIDLIRSLPLEAGRRVQDLTVGALSTGRRAESIAQEVVRTAEVTKARARLIARTEVARTAANLMMARAISAGSEGYVWRTSRDADVRDTHRAMEGRYVRWDSPPKTDPGLDPYHAGCGPNCRCFAEPVLPEL